MAIVITQFGGIAPKLNTHNLNDSGAQVAENCRLDGLDLSALPGPVTIFPSLPKAGTVRSLFRFRHATEEGKYWLHWTTDVDVVPGTGAGDTSQRLYFTGAGIKPGWTSVELATQGGQDYPVVSYELGIPVPNGVPVTAITQAAADQAQSRERRVYVYTYVSATGEEGAPSPPSAALSVVSGDTVTISQLPGAPAGAFVLAKKRIYRSVIDSNGAGEFHYVGEVLIGADSFVDKQIQANEALATKGFLPPPADLQGLTGMPNGILAGFSGHHLYFCEPYLPYAWPDKYRLTSEYPIVGLAAFGQSLLVATTGHPYIVTGIDPANMSMDAQPSLLGCVAKRSVVSTGDGAIYASANGLQGVGIGGSRLLSAETLRAEQWQALDPANMTAVWHNGRYLAFTPNGGLLLDQQGRFTTLAGFGASAAYIDPMNAALYIVTGGRTLQRFEAGPPLSLRWRSKCFAVGTGYVPSLARVEAAAYPLTFNLYIDGLLRHSRTVNSVEPFRLPSGLRGQTLEMEVSGTVSGIRVVATGYTVKELYVG
ncbi:hypothetical protein ACUHMQ_06615 [Chitinimonas sp. PSY-7]|uniref:hypothetical protein n=1 Tax=Chitinimonas sp. PSY-7 TaxID=3459088 RepID=UPI00403FDBB8